MSIVVATLCAEGIAMAADSRCLIQREESDLSTGEVKTRFLDLVLSGEKIIVTAQQRGHWHNGTRQDKG